MHPPSGSPETKFLLFHCGELICALPASAVKELLHMADLSSPPGLPKVLAGFLNLRGSVIPVLKLDRMFAFPESEPSAYTPLIILRTEPALGLLVQSVDQLACCGPEVYLPVPEEHIFKECVEAILNFAGVSVYLLSLPGLLLEQERHLLTEFQAMEQQRLLDLEKTAA